MENIIFEKRNEKIGIVRINRPKHLNSLNKKTLEELYEIIEVVEKDKNLSVLIITGEGEKAFVAGADITEMKDMNAIDAMAFSKLGNKVFEKIEKLGKIVIAAIYGYALGGGLELALACDIRIGNMKTKFGQPEVSLGIIPGFGGTQRLLHAVGIAKAKELIFTGDMIDAKEALTLGLLNKIEENPLEEAMDLGSKIVQKGPIALIQAKKAINFSYTKSIALDYEIECFANCFATEDQKEGMNAFIEKRKADFKNR